MHPQTPTGQLCQKAKDSQSREQRNPLLLFVLSGLFLFRFDARRLSLLLFQLPPRKTRYVIGPSPKIE